MRRDRHALSLSFMQVLISGQCTLVKPRVAASGLVWKSISFKAEVIAGLQAWVNRCKWRAINICVAKYIKIDLNHINQDFNATSKLIQINKG